MKHYRDRIKGVKYLTAESKKHEREALTERENGLNERDERLNEKERLLKSNSDLLDDTIHEIRKINNQIKGNILDLTKEIDQYEIEGDESEKFIHNVLRTLDANSSLLSIRMDAYDFMFNPASAGQELEVSLGVYTKIEKVYKCLYTSRKEKNIDIILNGRSDNRYRLRNSIELAFFIIIENAIKYSPSGEKIDIDFFETPKELTVEFKNWAICPEKDELEHLTERCYRSRRIVNNPAYKGNGLGLYLLKQICLLNNVKWKIEYKQDTKTIAGGLYNPFVVTLIFR